jgi:pimeloyl-ACP methyl ester carboxylesterase
MTALVLLLTAVTAAGPDDSPRILALGGDPAPGLLVNLSPGARPWDAPDPSRPAVVFVHGFNPTPRTVRFTMAERLAEGIARRGGPPVNVLSWSWNAATYVGLNPRVNAENNVAQGQRLAAELLARGVSPWRTHLIGHSAGGILAASAARALRAWTGQPVAQVTLLDPAAFYHDVIFERLAAPACARRVENYWAPGPSGYGRAVGYPGVANVRVDAPAPWLGAVDPLRSAHLHVVRWYLATVEDRSRPVGYNASAFASEGG